MNELPPGESGGELLLYQTEDGQVKLEVRLQNETVWLTQQMMAELLWDVHQRVNNSPDRQELQMKQSVSGAWCKG